MADTVGDARTRPVDAAIVDRLCNFLVVVINVILHLHQVYPARLFGMRNYDGLCVFLCRHPQVTEYITETVTTLREWLLKRQVESVTIVVYSVKTRKLVARYVYDIDVNVDVNSDPASSARAGEADLASLDLQLRAHVTRLMAVGGPYNVANLDRVQASITNYDDKNKSKKKDKGADSDEKSFDVLVNTTGINTPAEWVPANSAEQWAATNAVATPIKDADHTCITAAVCARVETDEI